MNNTEVAALFRDKNKLFQLISRVFPSAHLTPEKFQNLLNNAQSGGNPLLSFLDSPSSPTPEDAAAVAKQCVDPTQTLYALRAEHRRDAPFNAGFTESCQAVRVRLPKTPEQAKTIWTHLGAVNQSDHIIFSISEVAGRYSQAFGKTPDLERVDLITGARYLDLVRFSPISIYLAYEKEQDTQPIFYFLESGSATGSPEVLYYVDSMGGSIHERSGFSFTPFACPANWYNGGLKMNSAGTEPELIAFSVAQNKNGERHYLDLAISYSVVGAEHVICPGEQFVIAVMRVFALGLGLELENSDLARAFGEFCRDLLPWDEAPPTSGNADGYRGCPGS